LYKQVDKSKENESQVVSAMDSQIQNGGESSFQFFDNRPEAVAQRKLKNMADQSLQKENVSHVSSQEVNGVNIVQRALYHYDAAPFSEAEANAWNSLVAVAENFGIEANFIETVEADVYNPEPATTIGDATKTLSTAIAAHIRSTTIATTTADNFDWGDFHPQLTLMAASYGTLTGPVSTGGHQDDVYTYIVNGDTHRIAEPTNAHGRADGNINTRRGQMRAAIISYNDAVEAAASAYD